MIVNFTLFVVIIVMTAAIVFSR